MKTRFLVVSILVLMFAAGCTQTAPTEAPVKSTDAPVAEATAVEAQPTDVPADVVEEVSETLPAPTVAPTEEPLTEEPKAVVPQPALIGNYGCDGELRDYQEWCLLYNGVVTNTIITDLPANARTFPDLYDYSPATNQVLLGLSDWEKAGPGDFAASDLWLGSNPEDLDLQPLIYESVVVTAQFSPDGGKIAYLAGTEETLELHLLDLAADSDRVVAVDVTPSFVFSPDGLQIAFLRDSEWISAGDAFGLYIVSLETGDESMVLMDMTDVYEFTSPLYWSPDGQVILVKVRIINENVNMWKYMVYNLADGTSREVVFDPTTVNLYSSEMTDLDFVSPLLWAEDGSYFLASVVTGFMTPDMTTWVLKYNLNPALEWIISIDVVAEHAELVGWDLPGSSVWLKPTEKNEVGWPFSVPLP